MSDVEDLGRVYVGDLGLVGCGRPLTCRMQKTLKGFHVGKRARVLVEGVKRLKGSTELLEGLKVLKKN